MYKILLFIILLLNVSCVNFLEDKYTKPIKKHRKNGLDWNGFLKCLKKAGPKKLGVESLVESLEKEDYVKAMELIPLGFQKGSPEYEKCQKVWHP